ncbi:uncharacterized protein [Antennarius striatus]|uniref:uncharacterized protein n=1 Tax=Antennarius striatus TaxID=241820 RepID=UPI0035B1F2ED
MPVLFSGWDVVDDGASLPAEKLGVSQFPRKGRVYIMYHGTTVDNARHIITEGFLQSSGGMLGKGVYVSRDINKAAVYPRHHPSTDRVVLELRVRPGRVKRIANDNDLQFDWHANRYNTAWVPANCGLSAAPAGMEEDCVFNPRRVMVVGIAKAPDNGVQSELQQLVDSMMPGAGDGAAVKCSLCKRKTQHGAQHINQQCWKCGKNICILATKHFCP